LLFTHAFPFAVHSYDMYNPGPPLTEDWAMPIDGEDAQASELAKRMEISEECQQVQANKCLKLGVEFSMHVSTNTGPQQEAC
jgi:hypothetical protein